MRPFRFRTLPANATALAFATALTLITAAPLAADLSGDLAVAADYGYAGAFFQLPVGPKAIGAGNAWTALGGDPTDIFANPAQLVRAQYSAVAIGGSMLSYDRLDGYLAASWRKKRVDDGVDVWAAGLRYLSVDKIQGYDASAAPTSELSTMSFAAYVAYAWSLGAGQNSMLGGSLRFIHHAVTADSAGNGAAMDIGVNFHVLPIPDTHLAVALKDLGAIAYDGGTLWLKPLFTTAFRLRLPGIPAYLALQFDRRVGVEDGTAFRLGAEYTVFSAKGDSVEDEYRRAIQNKTDGKLTVEESRGTSLVMRIGLANGNLAGGFTFQTGKLEFSYAISYDPLEEGAGHCVGLTYNF